MSDSHYYSNYAATRDIDCFFRIGNVAYHFASNGQSIPKFITRKRNIAIQDLVYEMIPGAHEHVTIHKEVIEELIEKELVNIENLGYCFKKCVYLRSINFVRFANISIFQSERACPL